MSVSDPRENPKRDRGTTEEDSLESGIESPNDRDPAVSTDLDRVNRRWMQVAGLGFELASFTIGLALIGHWIDDRRGHEQDYATAIGALVGFAYGMFRFVRRALQSMNR